MLIELANVQGFKGMPSILIQSLKNEKRKKTCNLRSLGAFWKKTCNVLFERLLARQCEAGLLEFNFIDPGN